MSEQNARDIALRLPKAVPPGTSQLSTASYVIVAGSVLDVRRMSRVAFQVDVADENVTAKLVGRFVARPAIGSADAVTYGAWIDLGSALAITADTTGTLQLDAGELPYDEIGVMIKDTSGGTHGTATIFGSATSGGEVDGLAAIATALSAGGVNVAITYAAESADDIVATLTCGDAQQHDLDFWIVDANGNPLESAVVTAAIGTGTLLTTTAKASGRLRTNTSGVATLTLHDVAGASSQAFALRAAVAGRFFATAGAFDGS